MIDPRRTCPECLHQFDSAASAAAVQFCPRCGLRLPGTGHVEPLTLHVNGQEFHVGRPIQYGTTSNLYECKLNGEMKGVFKIARHPQNDSRITRQFDLLKRVRRSIIGDDLAPFIPQPTSCFEYQNGDEVSRRVVILEYHDGIDSPDELFSLEEVRAAHPNGIDARDMAWMYRRLLTAIARLHETGHAHGQLTPDHILIEPVDHKLVLVGWGSAAAFGQLLDSRRVQWDGWSSADAEAKPSTDISAAAKSMRYLLADPIEPAIARHLDRAAETISDAYRCLDDFDRLIEALWGARQFREFKMPPRVN